MAHQNNDYFILIFMKYLLPLQQLNKHITIKKVRHTVTTVREL